MLKIENIDQNDHIVLQLKGEIDASNSVDLDAAIQEMLNKGAKKILVDCAQLEYISSAGLGVFMSYLEEFQEKDVQIVIFGLLEKVHQVFVILGLDKLITIKTTQQDALEAML
ncbi:STAS domain-containing protein [Cecembia lonarensis]|uniref:Anti-sigma factor antagonist n=1 Tax=Cecembia lonarensis (strain CCUG 58316 / KCTC 22772 / LW9) TaxID=1225176 RepID=K1KW55_CECL9|nr:STAS domain-containing protein [Cecembia lonarensis]EKB48390.1 Putative anti-sigma factor antagonist [Cecembia lonarensis LW9]